MNPQLPGEDPGSPVLESLKNATRRRFLRDCGTGIGALALGSLLNPSLRAATPRAMDTGPALRTLQRVAHRPWHHENRMPRLVCWIAPWGKPPKTGQLLILIVPCASCGLAQKPS